MPAAFAERLEESAAITKVHTVCNYKIPYFGSMTALPLEIRLQNIDQIIHNSCLVMRSLQSSQASPLTQNQNITILSVLMLFYTGLSHAAEQIALATSRKHSLKHFICQPLKLVRLSV
ncbi:hypothetical protein Anacy_3274 [Anabaena cylindrica PCC 7122]|uniref:Uncharacterized protein n=1 Tax=Anabaena cylindrica (strain ATCC 27899 / PCC 7122) TaxID=272123 RepID=K9ZIT8_ANACC|nr:hypothetical protein Anacy_3274 [Anabaena cylindrica PCC 7122]BAY04310.1 hypothetical protein NIES19_35730 [Anabaena cylindrica PCC 7122]